MNKLINTLISEIGTPTTINDSQVSWLLNNYNIEINKSANSPPISLYTN